MKKGKIKQMLSPEKYIQTRARSLPLGPCYINYNWKESGMAMILVTRKHTNGNITWAGYQVDLLCLGVKDTLWQFNQHPIDFHEFLTGLNEKAEREQPDKEGPFRMKSSFMKEESYPLLHNIVYGAVEFADDLELKPHKDFDFTEYILEPDDDRIELIDVEFGQQGKPSVLLGELTYPPGIIPHLERVVGVGNFYFTRLVEYEYGQDPFEGEEDDEDDYTDDPFTGEEEEEQEGFADDPDYRDPEVLRSTIAEFRMHEETIQGMDPEKMDPEKENPVFQELLLRYLTLADILYYNLILSADAWDEAEETVWDLFNFDMSEELLSDAILFGEKEGHGLKKTIRNEIREMIRKTDFDNPAGTLSKVESMEKKHGDIPGIGFLKLQVLGIMQMEDEKMNERFAGELDRLRKKFPAYPPLRFMHAEQLMKQESTLDEGLALADTLIPIDQAWPETNSFCETQVQLFISLLITKYIHEGKLHYLDSLIDCLEDDLPDLIPEDLPGSIEFLKLAAVQEALREENR